MAKKKPSDPPTQPNRSPSWVVFARIDPDLQGPTEAYIASHEYPPAVARVLERALKQLLKDAGFWPPKPE